MALALDCAKGWFDVGGNFQVAGTVAQGGVASFRRPCLLAPTVSTSPLTVAADGGVVLSAQVNPQGRPTLAWLRVDTTMPATCSDTFGTRWPADGGLDAGAGSSEVGVAVELGSVMPGTTLHYCALASNEAALTAGQLVTTVVPSVPDAGSDGGVADAGPVRDAGSEAGADAGSGPDAGEVPDAGAGPRVLSTGCGCATTDGMAVGLAAVLLAAVKLRRRLRSRVPARA